MSIQTTRNPRLSKDRTWTRYIANDDARFGKSQSESHSNPKILKCGMYICACKTTRIYLVRRKSHTQMQRAPARARARSSTNAEQKHKALTPRRRVDGRRYCFSFTFAVRANVTAMRSYKQPPLVIVDLRRRPFIVFWEWRVVSRFSVANERHGATGDTKRETLTKTLSARLALPQGRR